MPTRMIHPQHGAMHAYGSGEIERLEGLGWEIEAPFSVSMSIGSQPPENVDAVTDAPIARKKPGPKPKAK